MGWGVRAAPNVNETHPNHFVDAGMSMLIALDTNIVRPLLVGVEPMSPILTPPLQTYNAWEGSLTSGGGCARLL